ncbi:MAG TPA: glycosyltransferase [bacterium]|nr:glycosyltransferase [bacterium]
MRNMKHPNKINILGVGISAIRMADAISKMEEWIEKNERHYVCVCPVSTIMECQKDERLHDIVNSAGLATPDGMPLVWLSKLNGFPYTERVYGPDLMLAFCKVAEEKGYSNFFYGGANGVPEKLARNLRKRFPRLKVAGTYSPPFRPLTQEEDQIVIEMINKAFPEVVWVGISTPKQDKWMAEHIGKINAPVMVGVGAAFNFFSGEVRQAPRWMQRSGLEWLFRLSQEPARLWYRYLVYNPLFVLNLLLQWSRLRKY